MNSYFDLGIKERDISFSSIWKSEKTGNNSYNYNNTLNPNDNYALASLYWINKDFYMPLINSPNPQAKRIKDMRNAFEHKYVKIFWLDLEANEESDRIDESELKNIKNVKLYQINLFLKLVLWVMMMSGNYKIILKQKRRTGTALQFYAITS